MNSWEICSVIVKSWNLISMAAVIGGGFSFYLLCRHNLKISRAHLVYLFAGAVSGLVSTVLFFLMQVGGVNQTGLAGAFDMTMAAILLETGLGSSTVLRISGYLLASFVALVLLRLSRAPNAHSVGHINSFAFSGLTLSVLVLSMSFAFTGHTVELGGFVRFAIVLHVLTALMWVGSLYPLFRLTSRQETTGVQILMVAFGNWMIPVLLMLLATGSFLVVSILEFPGALFTTLYGTSLFVKLSLVTGILLLGTSNKFQLVPYLACAGTRNALQKSIFSEMMLAVLILSLTSYFSTVIGIGDA